MGWPARRGFLASLGHAWDGLGQSWRSQRNLRIHVVLGVIALALAAVLGLQTTEWALLVAVMAWVIMAELLNTALEAVVELVQPELHPKARLAKDAAAGAVLVASAGALVVGAWLFMPKIWSRLGLGS